MSELVIVITDLYLGAARDAPASAPAVARERLPAVESVTRFGRVRMLEGGWRAWAARWLGLERYAQWPPASIAAAAAPTAPPGQTVWLAEPLHLSEGIGRVHLERRGRLRLAPAECDRLAADFNALYAGSGFALAARAGGGFLLGAPAGEPVRTCEPARVSAGTVAESLPSGAGAAVLRRLGAELEMWLHAHPLNAERAARGEPPVSSLWLWGGGAPAAAPVVGEPAGARVYGAQAYLAGLARLGAVECHRSPPAWPYRPGEPIGRALHGLEVSETLRDAPGADLAAAVRTLDRDWIGPAVTALHGRRLERLWLLANDRAWCLRRGDRWRRWRRGRTGLEALA